MLKRRISNGAAVFILAAVFTLAGCSKTETGKAPALASDEQSAQLTAEQTVTPVEEKTPAIVADITPIQETVTETVAAAGEEKPATVWQIGDAAPNGGLVYYAKDGEFYEVFPPQSAVAINDPLPQGWTTPDLEDLTLIYEGIQKAKFSDYGAFYYVSVSKSGGKNYFLKMDNGEKVLGAAQGRKIGVRKFDPSQSPAEVLLATSALVSAGSTNANNNAQTAEKKPVEEKKPATPAPKYAIGDTGPGGGIVFAYANGKYKEITKPENVDTLNTRRKREQDMEALMERELEPFRLAVKQAEDEFRKVKKEVYAKAKAEIDNNIDSFRTARDQARNDFINEADPVKKMKLSETYEELNYQIVFGPSEQTLRKDKDYLEKAKLCDAANNALSNASAKYYTSGKSISVIPAGWRTPDMPELIAVYDVLKKTGRVNFGNAVYLSSSGIGYKGSGADYTRKAVSYFRNASDFDKMRQYFPDAQVILTAGGGGGGGIFFMDMGDGAISPIDDSMPSGDLSVKMGWKNFTVGEIRLPLVREF